MKKKVKQSDDVKVNLLQPAHAKPLGQGKQVKNLGTGKPQGLLHERKQAQLEE